MAYLIEAVPAYPYHYGDTDAGRLVELLKATPGIEVRIRKLQ